MNICCRSLLLGVVACSVVSTAGAQQGGKKYDEMSLEELLNQEVTVASKRSLTPRESPGILTVISGEEIADSGARDLVDVLQMVPGFHFGVDVEGVVGVGVRGNWGHEGKVLLLVDGQEFNEPLYSTLQFGNHFAPEQIERIEIIRGPGSAIYGGNAELAVINVVTKGAEALQGGAVYAAFGQMADGLGRRTAGFSVGRRASDLGFSLHLFGGKGSRSDRVYRDLYGGQFYMKDNSDLDPFNLNSSIEYKGLSARVLIDRYRTTSRDAYDAALERPLGVAFDSYFLDLKYDRKVNQRLTLSPRFNYKLQRPWTSRSEGAVDTVMFYERQAERYTGSLLALYDASSRLRVTGGAEVYRDLGSLIDGGLSPESLFNGGASEVGYTNGAVFGEGALTTDWVNLTLGARFNRHSQFGSSFVPRLALTKVAGKFHVKALFSKAFRAPAINYIDLNPLIKPERTTVWELEAGYRLSQRSFLSANVFDVTIHKPIVFSFDEETQTDQYQNFSQTGTRGFELDYRYKADRGYAGFTCSYYATAGKNEVDYYRVENHGNLLLAFPPHKWTAHGSIQLARKVSLNPSLVCLGARYGYVFDESTQGPAVHKFNSTLLANLYLRLEDIGGTGLELGAGIFDLFGQNYPFIQPYAGSHAPLPAPSREFVVRFGYRWSFATP